MIELVSQVDSKIPACGSFMQPMGNRLVPNMLTAGANREIIFVRIVCENELCNPNGSFIPPAFSYFSTQIIVNFTHHCKKLDLIY